MLEKLLNSVGIKTKAQKKRSATVRRLQHMHNLDSIQKAKDVVENKLKERGGNR